MAEASDGEQPPRPLDVAVRAYAVRDEARQPVRTRADEPRTPRHFLVFDTETSTDPDQRLIFGSFRYLELDERTPEFKLVCLQEGLFHADDLSEWNPDALRVLRGYVEPQPYADVAKDRLTVPRRLRLVTQTEFLDRIFWRVANNIRGAVVCFNSPFDLSRLAWRVGYSRDRSEKGNDSLASGFAFALWHQREGKDRTSQFRRALAIKSIDSKRSLKGLRSARGTDWIDQLEEGAGGKKLDRLFRGEFLDLRTLAFALTDEGHTLESACNAFGVPYEKREGVQHGIVTPEYIDYCCEDTEATARLLEATTREFLRHPIDLPASRAYSPATIGKSYLRKMGVEPPRTRQHFDPKLLGWSMSAYYGGRAECRIRRAAVQVIYCDFMSMYPTVCGLLGAWDLLTCAGVRVVEDTDQVQQLVDEVTLDQVFDKNLWPQLLGIAQIQPDGDVLPVRARYSGGQAWQIGVNPLTSEVEPMWFTLADLVASKLLTGRAPQLIRTFRLVPRGKADGLEPIEVLGEIPFDPAVSDFFREIVEERQRTKRRTDIPESERDWRSKGLKVIANSASYGIYAQMTRRELPNKRKDQVTVYGARPEPHRWRTPSPEDPGDFCFPPLAAAITGGARLMLAALERSVVDAGGTYAFCDTDSMAIVASRDGGEVDCGQATVRALAAAEVDQIRNRFQGLSPYGPEVGGSILEIEDENFEDPLDPTSWRQLYCYSISAKRYVLYNLDRRGEPELRAWTALDDDQDAIEGVEPSLRKSSEHGLGHLLNPVDPEDKSRDWIAEAWMFLLRRDLGLPAPEPDWLDRPAIGRTSVSSPRLHRLLGSLNTRKPYGEQIKPFNFLNVAFVPVWERPADEQRMVLLAPYERDSARWLEVPWINRYSGREFRITTDPSGGLVRGSVVTVQTYRDVLDRYVGHPEAKSSGPDGVGCQPDTRGLMERRSAVLGSLRHIGKESNRLEEVETGLILDGVEVANEYDDLFTSVFLPLALPRLRALGVRETARRTGFAPSSVSAVLSGASRPRRSNLREYLFAADVQCARS